MEEGAGFDAELDEADDEAWKKGGEGVSFGGRGEGERGEGRGERGEGEGRGERGEGRGGEGRGERGEGRGERGEGRGERGEGRDGRMGDWGREGTETGPEEDFVDHFREGEEDGWNTFWVEGSSGDWRLVDWTLRCEDEM